MSDNQDQQNDLIGYSNRTQNALRGMIKDVLAETVKKGLDGEHHFYISFATTYNGVVISDRLLKNHPEEMTIVLQNQFEDLGVTEDGFTVRLSFNQHPETLVVPFKAMTRFYDPSVSFGLMFDDLDLIDWDEEALFDLLEPKGFEDNQNGNMAEFKSTNKSKTQSKEKSGNESKAQPENESKAKPAPEGEIVSLDAFRKNKD